MSLFFSTRHEHITTSSTTVDDDDDDDDRTVCVCVLSLFLFLSRILSFAIFLAPNIIWVSFSLSSQLFFCASFSARSSKQEYSAIKRTRTREEKERKLHWRQPSNTTSPEKAKEKERERVYSLFFDQLWRTRKRTGSDDRIFLLLLLLHFFSFLSLYRTNSFLTERRNDRGFPSPGENQHEEKCCCFSLTVNHYHSRQERQQRWWSKRRRRRRRRRTTELRVILPFLKLILRSISKEIFALRSRSLLLLLLFRSWS